MTPADEEYLKQTLEEARRGLGRTSPNPAVGALLVRDGEVVGRGHHTWAGVKARRDRGAGGGGRPRARRDVVHQPGALLSRRANRSLRGCADRGRSHASGRGDAGPESAGGRRRVRTVAAKPASRRRWAARLPAEAEKLNEAFVHFMRTGGPLVTLKAALTLDGKIAAPDDNEGWITSERARLHVQEMRHTSDAILTGIGTVLSDDCLLTDRTRLPRAVLCCASCWTRSCGFRCNRRWWRARRGTCWW